MANPETINRLARTARRFYPEATLVRESCRLFGHTSVRNMTEHQRRLFTHWLRALNALGWARELIRKRTPYGQACDRPPHYS